MPKVSVLTPIYKTNHNELREMIESVLSQSFADFEFIILNDSPSCKDLKEIVLSYKDNRIKYFENDVNLGISASRNKLIDLASGEYIAVLDHDDVCVKERLELEVEFLDSHKDIGCVGGLIRLFSNNTTVVVPEMNLDIKIAMVNNISLIHTTIMFRKEILDFYKIRYENQYSPCEDYMLFLRMMDHTLFHNLQVVLVNYRDSNTNTSSLQAEKMQDKHFMCLNYAYAKFPALLNKLNYEESRKKTIKLFNLLPILKIRKTGRSIKIFLFGCICIISLKF